MERILRGLRIAYDYSTSELSKKMGISQSYISKIENGDCIPSEEVIKKYCKTFHLSRKAIMLFSKEANSKKDITNQQILLMILKKICDTK